MSKFLCMFLVFTPLAHAAVQEISIEKFLKLAMKADPEYLSLESEKKSLKNLVDKNLPSNAAVLSLSSEKGYSSVEGSDTTEVRSAISKPILSTGSTITLSKLELTRPGREEDVSSVRLEQNLLRNAFGRDLRLQEKNLNKLRDIEKIKVIEKQEAYIVNILSYYLNYKKSKLDYELAQKVYAEAKVVRDNVARKFRLKIANRADLDQTELLLLQRNEELITVRSRYEDARRRIVMIIGMDIDQLKISNEEKFFAKLESKTLKLFEKENLKNRDLIQSELAIDQKEGESILAERQNGAELDLILGYNKNESQLFSATIDQDETVVGLRLSIPLGDDNSKAIASDAKIASYRAQLEKRRMQDEVKLLLSERIQSLKNLSSLITFSEKQQSLSKRIVSEQERKYKIGKVSLERLIEAKNDYATYRKNHQARKYDYRIELVEFLALTDSLEI